MSGSIILITGASGGIGAELARQLAPGAPRLVLSARSADKLEAVAQQCRAAGASVITVTGDVATDADCQRMVRAALDHFGGLDVLIANAGVSMHARFDEVTDCSTYERLWRINALGTIQCVRHAWPALKASRGQVVGVCSLAGKVGVPGRTTYCASKFAQAGFLDALRVEAEEFGIGVTVVYPGVVDTDIRRNGWNGAGQRAGVSGLKEGGAMPVHECARQILAAVRGRRRQLVMTRLGLWLQLIAPRLVDRMSRAALAKPSRKVLQ